VVDATYMMYFYIFQRMQRLFQKFCTSRHFRTINGLITLVCSRLSVVIIILGAVYLVVPQHPAEGGSNLTAEDAKPENTRLDEVCS
jgi:hypothetical protein